VSAETSLPYQLGEPRSVPDPGITTVVTHLPVCVPLAVIAAQSCTQEIRGFAAREAIFIATRSLLLSSQAEPASSAADDSEHRPGTAF
jgi:hypothetical protein